MSRLHLQVRDKGEVLGMVFSFDMKKSVGSNSIPQKNFILFKNKGFKLLQDIFIFYFSSEIVPSVHKFSNVVSVCKNYSKLDHGKFRFIFLLGG